MEIETTSLRIKAERLGTITEVTTFLTDLETAYNSIYAFNFLVDTLERDRNRRLEEVQKNIIRYHEYRKEFLERRDSSFDSFLYEIFFEEYAFGRLKEFSPNLLELQSKIDINKIILPSDRLIISKVNIQSPGFWEVLGSLNPLQQIREYLKDRHERKKDREYRNIQEKEKGELDIEEKRNTIVNQRIEILRRLGYSDTEIRQLVMSMVIQPLNRLGKHQDNNQIDGPDE